MAALSGCIRRWPLRAGLLLLSISACTGDPADPDPDPDPPLPTSCDGEGTSHSGSASGTWLAAEGPHLLTATVYVGNATLTIESGALVCGAEGAAIVLRRGGRLVATGASDSMRITFTATDSTRPWGGIVAPEYVGTTVTLANVLVEHAEQGVHAENLSVKDAVIREIRGSALSVASGSSSVGSVRSTRIENACLAGTDGAAVVQQSYTALTLDGVTIRGSGCDGITTYSRARLSLSDVAIEGSAGMGLDLSSSAGGDPELTSVAGLRITGGADRPARLTGDAAAAILAAVPADHLTGNAIDRVVVTGHISTDYQVTAQLGLELEAASWSHWEFHLTGSLTLDPGSQLVLRGYLTVAPGQLVALGTASDPIRIEAPDGGWEVLRFDAAEADTTRLEHVHLDRVGLRAKGAHAVHLSAAEVTRGWVELRAPGSTVENTVIGSASRFEPDADFAALTLGAPGISVVGTAIEASLGHGIRITAPGARVEGCSITGNAGAGVLVADEGGSAVIRGCDLVANAGAGLHNATGASVDAESNWWGDPAGPEGENGDGVVGDVDFEPWLDEPAVGDSTG